MLTRSSTDRRLFGVCGGLGEYFNIDSNIIRLIFLVAIFSGGVGLLLYFLMVLVIPADYQVSGNPKRAKGPQFVKPEKRNFKARDVTPDDEDEWSNF